MCSDIVKVYNRKNIKTKITNIHFTENLLLNPVVIHILKKKHYPTVKEKR